MGFIYILISPSRKKYVGQTSRSITQRLKDHQYPNNCVFLYKAIQKYSLENFDVHYFEWVDDWDLDYIEMVMIEELGTLAPDGYNLKNGGGSYGKMSEVTRKKISDAQRGEKNFFFGKRGELAMNSRRVYQYDKQGKLIYDNPFISIQEAAKSVGGHGGHISECALGKRKSAYGFRWSFTLL
ncbi:GIY-YIG catalytic domain-containing endonuclease [Paramecium bursaria Chlorella virus NY2B]|nr:GIY-YIG catalytic domain-containing endonuclease [Paramecium bursaria Chlorella virus NY2B]